MPAVLIALLLAAAFGGGVATAANNALPGNLLWGFKTAVNENIEGEFATGAEAKANWDIAIATVRLDEAQRLAGAGTLDASAQAAITANLNIHVKNISDHIALLKVEDETAKAAGIASRFQAMLVQHTAGLAQAPASFLTYIRGLFDEAATLQQ